LRDNTVRIQLERQPGPQGALLAIDNSTGRNQSHDRGYSFEDSKFNRATQAVRQVAVSFKVYVYADALERGSTPFDTIVDLRLPPSAAANRILRAITMKNLKEPSRCDAPLRARATFRP